MKQPLKISHPKKALSRKTFTGHKKLVAWSEIKLQVIYYHEDLFVNIWCVRVSLKNESLFPSFEGSFRLFAVSL